MGKKPKGKAKAKADDEKGWEPKPTPSDQVAAAITDAVAFIREGLLEKAQVRATRASLGGARLRAPARQAAGARPRPDPVLTLCRPRPDPVPTPCRPRVDPVLTTGENPRDEFHWRRHSRRRERDRHRALRRRDTHPHPTLIPRSGSRHASDVARGSGLSWCSVMFAGGFDQGLVVHGVPSLELKPRPKPGGRSAVVGGQSVRTVARLRTACICACVADPGIGDGPAHTCGTWHAVPVAATCEYEWPSVVVNRSGLRPC